MSYRFKLWLLVFGSLPVSANDNVLGYFELMPPFAYVEQGQVKGIYAEALQSLLSEHGISLKTEVLPWKRAYNTAQLASDSFLYPVGRMPSREADFNWLVQLDVICPAIIGLKGANLVAKELVKRHSIALVRDDYTAQNLIIDGVVDPNMVVWVADHHQMIDLLLNQRVDLIAGDVFHLGQIMLFHQQDPERLVTVSRMSQRDSSLYLVMPKAANVRLQENLRVTLNTAVLAPGGFLYSNRRCNP